MYYKIAVDMVLSADGDKDEMQDAIVDALVEVAERFGGELGGSVMLVPTTEEELEAEAGEVLDERRSSARLQKSQKIWIIFETIKLQFIANAEGRGDLQEKGPFAQDAGGFLFSAAPSCRKRSKN